MHTARFPLPLRLLPAGAPPQLRHGCRLMGLAAVPLWTLSIAAIWVHWDWRSVGVIRTLAAVAIIGAIVCWAVSWLHDSQQRALTRLTGDLYRRIPEQDRPPLLAASGR